MVCMSVVVVVVVVEVEVEVVILMKLFGEWNSGEGFFSIVIIIAICQQPRKNEIRSSIVS